MAADRADPPVLPQPDGRLGGGALTAVFSALAALVYWRRRRSPLEDEAVVAISDGAPGEYVVQVTGYNGASIATEDGSESFNVFDHNFAIRGMGEGDGHALLESVVDSICDAIRTSGRAAAAE